MIKKLAALASAGVLLFGIAACSNDDTATPEITITKQWARTSPMATDMGAAYMTIEASALDELIGASVDMSIAMMAEVHKTVTVDGASKMQEVERLEVSPNAPIEMEPGGYHIMLMGLKKPLVTSETIQVTLKFSKSGETTVDVPVLEDAP